MRKLAAKPKRAAAATLKGRRAARGYASSVAKQLDRMTRIAYRKYLKAFGTPTEKIHLRIEHALVAAWRKIENEKEA